MQGSPIAGRLLASCAILMGCLFLRQGVIAADDPAPSQPDEPQLDRRDLDCLERLLSPFFDLEEDPDGPINTDRPTFTPANSVVPNGRLQLESGYTFTHDLSTLQRFHSNAFPELAVRYGFMKRAELRFFWSGQTYLSFQDRATGRISHTSGPSDLEAGFKWQLSQQDRWVPQTALITSMMVPTGGNGAISSQGAYPYINLLYGWSITEHFGITGSTGYTGMRQPTSDTYERYNQSLVASYTPVSNITLFHEWYVLMKTNAADNRPQHYMDTGLLYRPTPNTQFDIRGGLGLSDGASDLFAGAGFSIRF